MSPSFCLGCVMSVKIKKRSPTKAEKALAPVKARERKFKRVHEMDEEIRDVMHGMFADGKPVSEIVATLRGFELFGDVSDQSLGQYLYRYKWEVLDKQLVVRAEALRDTRKAKVLAQVTQQLDVIQEVTELIIAQKTRVGKLLNREKDMPMLFNSLGGEMKTLAGFVQQYADLSFDLGTLKKAPQVTKITKDGETTLVESEGRDHVMFNLENSKKVEEAARAFYDVLNEPEEGDYEHEQSL